MMMKMLDAGGLPSLTDFKRLPDESNLQGYYEFERVKSSRMGIRNGSNPPGEKQLR
jgi:hypothetical protein